MWYTQVNNQQKKAWKNNLKDILDQVKQAIDANSSEQPTGTLAMNFHKPAGEANPYDWFGYGPHSIFYHTRGQVSVSMNAYMINTNKKVNHKWCKYENLNSTEQYLTNNKV